jgi:hypothetical protein
VIQFLGQSIWCHAQQILNRANADGFHHLSRSRTYRRRLLHFTGTAQKETHSARSLGWNGIFINSDWLRTSLARHLTFPTCFATSSTFVGVQVTHDPFTFTKPQVTFRGRSRCDSSFDSSVSQTSRC